MLPIYNTLSAVAKAKYQSLAAIDTDGVYECLDPNCCTGLDNIVWTNLYVIDYLLQQYLLTGVLPILDNPCCYPVCGQIEGGTPTAITSPTFTDLTVTDDFTLGGAPSIDSIRRGTGTLVGGTLVIAATWVTATSRIVATYTQASAAGQANISRGTITPGVSFVINGEGTNTFDWIAVV